MLFSSLAAPCGVGPEREETFCPVRVALVVVAWDADGRWEEVGRAVIISDDGLAEKKKMEVFFAECVRLAATERNPRFRGWK